MNENFEFEVHTERLFTKMLRLQQATSSFLSTYEQTFESSVLPLFNKVFPYLEDTLQRRDSISRRVHVYTLNNTTGFYGRYVERVDQEK